MPIPRTCIKCGKEFLARPNAVRIGWGKFCSVICQRQYRKGNEIEVYEDHAVIISSNGERILCDVSDLPLLSPLTWTVRSTPNSSKNRAEALKYASASLPGGTKHKSKTVKMHRFLLGTSDDQEVDHRNGNGLDNRRFNLRPAERNQNSRNVGLRFNNVSGYKGVSWKKDCNAWRARIMVDEKEILIGLYSSKEAAALAYNQAAIKYHGEFANLNDLSGIDLESLDTSQVHLRACNTSGYRGVHFDKQNGKWRAYITITKKRISLGYHATKEEAARAYNAAAITHYGDKAKLNPI